MASYPIDASNAMEFYTLNDVIFITGGSGFIGITLIEKILRSLPQVKKIYTLLRISEKASLQDRFEEVISNRVFETLRSNYSSEKAFREKVASKIIPIQGDIAQEELGINPKDMEMILSDTSIVIHSAANIRFDEPLHLPLNLNTRATLRLLDIAKRMPRLASFNHISTVFIVPTPYLGRSMETIQPMRIMGDPKEIFETLSNMSNEEMAIVESEVLKFYPNTYSFTKSLVESLIQSKYEELGLPIVIVRPSGVLSAMSEPAVGWTLGLGTALSQVKAVGLGQIQEWVGDGSNLIDFVPVDYVCKTILAATVTADRSRKSPLVYQVGTSHNKGIQLRMSGNYIESYWRSAPIPRMRTSNDIRCEYYPLKEFNYRFDQRFRAKIEQARMYNDQKAIEDFQWLREKSSMFEYYHSTPFIFDLTNAIQLDETAPKELRSGLKFEMDWKDYMYRVCFGVHKYILDEPVEFTQPTQFTYRL